MALGSLVLEILHFFVVDFFLYGQDIFDQNIISIILHCHWSWYNIFLMSIISSKDSIPQCDFKLPEVCDVIEKCMSYGQELSNLGYKFLFSDKSKPRDWLFLPMRYVQILFISH